MEMNDKCRWRWHILLWVIYLLVNFYTRFTTTWCQNIMHYWKTFFQNYFAFYSYSPLWYHHLLIFYLLICHDVKEQAEQQTFIHSNVNTYNSTKETFCIDLKYKSKIFSLKNNNIRQQYIDISVVHITFVSDFIKLLYNSLLFNFINIFQMFLFRCSSTQFKEELILPSIFILSLKFYYTKQCYTVFNCIRKVLLFKLERKTFTF